MMKQTVVRVLAAMALIGNVSAKQALNLIAIVTDDQAAWTPGCYGGQEIRTPNLDRLAAEGVRFANAFVHTPVCSPSRGTYMTALLGTQLGYTDWLNDGQAKTQGVTPASPTWPSVLAANGYLTCLIGKWHLGAKDESLPWHNGLTQFTGNLGGGWTPNKVHFITEKGEKLDPPGFSVEICTELAMKFVDEHKDKPFALLVHYREPHAPYVPMPEKDMDTSRKADIKVPDYPGLKQPYTKNARRDYYASIAAVDRNVGRLLDHLDKSGLAGRTIVTFTSDHGYNIGEHGIQHKGNGCWITEDRFQQPRPNMFDTSIRVPLMIRYPGGAKPGTVVEEWVTNADMFATVLGLLGIEKPAAVAVASRDYSAAVRGETLSAEAFPHELFGQYDLVNNPTKRHMRMVRTDRWKLILHLNAAPQNELYDLAADPGERKNLFGQPGTEDTVRDLTKRIRRHMAAIKDPRLQEVQ
jgi:choline-sulfatase